MLPRLELLGAATTKAILTPIIRETVGVLKKLSADTHTGMPCPSWQWHRTGSSWFQFRTLPVAPLWCDLGFFEGPNSRGNKAAANLRPPPPPPVH